MTIEGIPNQLYSQGMRQYQQWDEINKYFALTSKRDKETDKVAKDLYFWSATLPFKITLPKDLLYGWTCVPQMTTPCTAAAEGL